MTFGNLSKNGENESFENITKDDVRCNFRGSTSLRGGTTKQSYLISFFWQKRLKIQTQYEHR